ncbi:uncharacterized protein CDAR_540791 [Caerostris darwini]|uniref:Uncharacterized protein n=1 Tax=Caerostris darwini TaxID=1538125 RepID=A0AAV4SEI3_9ARAC|nr:uncharacterized protein CDAR_540791 [Caerostris darwini]
MHLPLRLWREIYYGDTSVLTDKKDNSDTAYKKFSLSGSSDEEMIDITAGGENMESHFEQTHAVHGEPVQVNFLPMPDTPESNSDSDNEYSKLQGNYFAINIICNMKE